MTNKITVRALPFHCPNCGSFMVHKVKTHSLECVNCKSTKAIDVKAHQFQKELLSQRDASSIVALEKIVDCPGCGADIDFSFFELSKNCPYCKTPLVTKAFNKVPIAAIIPFFIDKNEAKTIFKNWLGSLWFAPNSLSNLKNFEHNFKAIYTPYFSFDAKTRSFYQGQRGDAYYVQVERTIYRNGREEIIREMERRIQWYDVQGVVKRDFYNILIEAQKDLPTIIQKLKQYDLNRLLDFNPSFLSGYEALEYNQEIQDSFIKAKKYMESIIYEDVIWDIGGDEQRVYKISTNYQDEKFELLFLPVWISRFKYANKEYDIVINGVSGEIIGERPYSYIKILLLIIFLITIAAIFYIANSPELSEKLFSFIAF